MTGQTYRGYTPRVVPTADLKVGDRMTFPACPGWPTPIARITRRGDDTVIEATYESWGRRRIARVRRQTTGRTTIHVPAESPAGSP